LSNAAGHFACGGGNKIGCYSRKSSSNTGIYCCHTTAIVHTTALVLKKESCESQVKLDVGIGREMGLDEHHQLSDHAHRLETKHASKNDQVILALV